MRSKRVIMMSVLMASLLFPLALGVEAAGPTKPPEAISEEEARQFIDKYVDRYKAMDIDLFMELFSKKSIENRSVLYPDIRTTYQKMFAVTSQFLYYPTIYSVQTQAQSALVMGRYRLIQTLKRDSSMRTFQGNIQWTLVKEDGSLKIKEMNYGRSQGND